MRLASAKTYTPSARGARGHAAVPDNQSYRRTSDMGLGYWEPLAIPATLRSLRRTKDVTHSILDLLSETVHEISSSLFASFSLLLPWHLTPAVSRRQKRE